MAQRVSASRPGQQREGGFGDRPDLFRAGAALAQRFEAAQDRRHEAGEAGRVLIGGEVARALGAAAAALFLATDEASFVNGVEFFVDGGQAQV